VRAGLRGFYFPAVINTRPVSQINKAREEFEEFLKALSTESRREQAVEYWDHVHALEQYPFERYLDLETFIVALQSRFVQDETTTALLKLVGNVSGEAVANFSDDGVTQKVLAKTGIVRVEEAAVPNPVMLAPYRTFLEVRQPASRFIYRLKQEGAGIKCALIEADGGNWKLEAIALIRDWLKEALPEEIVILA
jgi:hypothetical protein